MGRQQGKNTVNNINSNTVAPETNDSTTGRSDHPNEDEAENDLKNNFVKKMETLNEELKNSLKRMEEKNQK